MKKIGVFVGEEMWTFFNEIYDDLNAHYETEIYKKKIHNTPLLYGRLNRWVFNRQLRSMLRRNGICFFEWASELLAAASKMPKNCAIVTRLHSFELHEWAPKINWDAVDKIILISNAMQRQFVTLYPEQAHKTEVVYNGRSLDAFSPPAQKDFDPFDLSASTSASLSTRLKTGFAQDKFRLGMLCHIKPIKRIYEVILMLYELRRQGYNAALYIAGEAQSAGDMRYQAAIHRLVEELELNDAVIFDGFVTDAPGWLQGIDIFISNSFWEGQQVALLEAMACGRYCLSHAWAGAEELLPPENLYVTETELQQKIIDYYEMPLAEKQSRQAQLRTVACEKFDIERTKADIRQIIDAME